ncbi:MAG: sigma-54 dependent transcriptional regulator [bacterium]|nr:sigma-54 dependent transcriptional regulator [bacterium]
MARILIIDDDARFSRMLAQMVERMDHQAVMASCLAEGREKAAGETFDVVLLDVRLPDGSGLEAIRPLRESPSAPEVIIITGAGDRDGAQMAVHNGAWDYIQKTSTIKEMTLPFVRALQYREEKKAARTATVLKREAIRGNGPAMNKCLGLLAQAAGSTVNVLLTGETGSGKDLFAQAIHANSSRARQGFIVVDCTALPETLVESILFGHERGAFTGADRARSGLVAQADGGTLFLDEIGELPLKIQKTFLRVLQELRFRPLGGKEEIKSDFRLISATNKNLDQLVQAGQFREDLLFRLRAFPIEVPPLREHPEDIKEIAVAYMNQLCERHGIGTKGFSPEFFPTLEKYPWPGNVRELLHTLDWIFTVAHFEPTIFPQHLPEQVRVSAAQAPFPSVKSASPASAGERKASGPGLPPLQDIREAALSEVEKSYLQDLLSFTKGNIKEACRVSGLSQSRLYTLLKKYEIPGR